jgi:hypothetical protein
MHEKPSGGSCAVLPYDILHGLQGDSCASCHEPHPAVWLFAPKETKITACNVYENVV